MTRRGKMISRSRKEPDCHDPEKKKWFLGQEKNRIAMTRRRKNDF